MFEKLKRLFINKIIDEEKLEVAVAKKWITGEEKEEIIKSRQVK
ncbi:MAG TPA: XkdX family protein [Clostridiales bacterium]|nr:XkdX family protein [Clostridiales bacterium]